MKCSRCGKDKLTELWVNGEVGQEGSWYLCSECRSLLRKEDDADLLLFVSDDTIFDSVNLLIWLNDPLLVN